MTRLPLLIVVARSALGFHLQPPAPRRLVARAALGSSPVTITLADIGDELVSQTTTSVEKVDASIYLPIFIGGVFIFAAGVIGAYIAVVRWEGWHDCACRYGMCTGRIGMACSDIE